MGVNSRPKSESWCETEDGTIVEQGTLQRAFSSKNLQRFFKFIFLNVVYPLKLNLEHSLVLCISPVDCTSQEIKNGKVRI